MTENRHHRNALKRAVGGIRWYDWLIFFLVALGCHLIFQQPDIRHTGGAGIAYLNGHILDFYSYNKARIGGCAYMPTTYILFAIWNIPLRVLGFVTDSTMNVGFWVTFWYTLLPILAYMGCSVILFKLAELMGFSSGKARIAAYGFATAPIGFYSQFIFGQYDSLTLFFTLLGVYYFFRRDNVRFVLFFGIAITCKYFAFLIFLPMLLLREKKVWGIIRKGIGVAIPFALEIALYLPDKAMRSSVGGFGAVGYIFNVSLNTGYNDISLVLVLWVALCAWAFFTNPGSGFEEFKWFIYLESLVCFLTFGLSMWHPQWLLLAMPFLLLGTMMHRRSDVFWLLDIVLMGAYLIFVLNFWVNALDQELLRYGLLGSLIGNRVNVGLTMQKFTIIHDLMKSYSAVSALFLVNALFKHPKYLMESPEENTPDHVGLIRLRFLGGIALFLVPAMICVYSMLQQPYPNVNVITAAHDPSWVEFFEPDSVFEQHFTATKETAERLDAKFDTKSTPRQGTFRAELVDCETEETLTVVTSDLSTLREYVRESFAFEPVALTTGHEYKWVLSIQAESEGATGLYYEPTRGAREGLEADVNGEKQQYTFALETLGR